MAEIHIRHDQFPWFPVGVLVVSVVGLFLLHRMGNRHFDDQVSFTCHAIPCRMDAQTGQMKCYGSERVVLRYPMARVAGTKTLVDCDDVGREKAEKTLQEL